MIDKRYIKTRKSWKITFRVPPGELPENMDVKSLSLVGDFNSWDPKANPMSQNKDGTFKGEIEVEPGSKVRFRYVANGKVWFNAWDADGYMPNRYGEEDCVVVVNMDQA